MGTTSQDTGLHLIRRIRSLPEKRQRALIALLRKQGVDLSALETIPRLSRTDGAPVPLSFTQQRLWFLAQLDGTSAAYNIPMAMRLRGRLDRAALLRALEAIVQRHEVLRTRFADHGGVPCQIIGDGGDFTVAEEELTDPARLAAICRDEAAAPFDLERGPLIRVRLLRQSEQEHHLLVTTHHSVSDGWSVGVFFRDLVALYEAFGAGRPDPLEPLPVQYADYAHWQRERLAGDLHDRQSDYWKRQLAGIDPRLTLPADRERPRVKTYAGARESFTCPADLLGTLREVAKCHDATLYMTLLAAYTVVLHRYTHQSDIAVGTVVAGRGRREVEDLVGFFANTLVMRTDLSDDPDFGALLARVKKTALEAYDHQDVPFDAVVDALDTERSLAHSPVFQTLFVLQEAQTRRDVTLGGLEVSPVDIDLSFTKFDLTVDVRETPDGLVGTVEYNTDLYDADTIRRFVRHYTTLLASVAADPREKVSRLVLLDEDERRRVLTEWNGLPDGVVSGERTVHEWFEKVAAGSPDAVAVEYEGRSLTYGELNARANRLARHLRGLGVDREVLVALCLPRSEHLVVCVLAVLKAGGAYVPLDPASPAERLDHVLRDSAPRVLVVDRRVPEGLDTSGTTVIDVRADTAPWDGLSDGALEPAEVGSAPSDAAYVIYTSGSTGVPKGVLVEHRNVTRLFTATEGWFGFGSEDVWTLFHSFAFDFSVWEMWGALLYGGRLVVVPQAVTRDPGAFYELLCSAGVTVLNQTPSAFRQLTAAQGEQGAPHRLRSVVFGGEALDVAALAPWLRRPVNRETQLVNMYGITETTVHVTYRPLTEADILGSASPIGVRIPDLRVYVLDGRGEPVPVGAVGELHVGGAGVARGYLNRPELTEQRFLPDPFAGQQDARMYRSGDLVRQRHDGSLEYVGRNDDQVKVRGFRIELGEIEAAVGRHEAVRSCAVVAREDQPGGKQLAAYVVLADGHGEQGMPAELGRHAERLLPEYMVPSAFVVLPALPLTTNGKLDRRALPAPGIDAYVRREHVAPSTATERAVAAVWADLLGFDEETVGAGDNFFELGGHSLLITVFVARLKELGHEVSVRSVFASPTLARLAAEIDEGVTAEAYEPPPNLVEEGCERITPQMLPLIDLTQEQIDTIADGVPGGAPNVQDVYPLLPTQEGILFHHLMNPDHDPYLVSTLYVADDEATCTRFTDALQAVVDRHDVMRTAVLTTGLPEPVQVVLRAARVPVERVRLAAHGDAEEQARALSARPARMTLDSAPLLRLTVAEDPHSERRYLVLTTHHLIEDATSLRLTLRELALHLAGRTDLLPPPAPYRDFVAHTLRQQASADAEEYFRTALGDVTEPTLPFGLADVHGDTRRVAQLRRTLPEELTRDLRAHAKRLRLSPACLFHAAWARVVAACSNRDDVVFGSVMSGRLQGVPGVERMLGNFINTLPLRVRLDGRTVRELIDEVDAGLRDLVAREQTPLGLAQRCSGMDGDAPLFSAVANFRHFESGHDETAAIRIDDAGVRFVAAADGINYPVSVSVDDFGSELSLDLQVVDTLSADAVADYLLCALTGLSDALTASDGTGTQALDIEVLPASERRRLLTEWNDTSTAMPAPTLTAAFAAQVARTPDVTALVYEDETLSYAEFDARANRLAHWLIDQGAGPEQLVGVGMPRSFDLLVAIYGILKSGAAYLPLDPDLPDERREQMASDGRPLLVLTELPDTSGLPDTDPGVEVLPDNPAYVLYTSGTTGRPKGVVITHRASMNWLAWDQGVYRGKEGDRILFKTSIGFDVSIKELFWPLQVGATIVIARPGGQKDPGYLASAIREHRVTDIDFVPSMLAEFLAEPAAAQCTGLVRLEATGEPLSVELAERVVRTLPDTLLYNLCGPTEVGGALGLYDPYDPYVPDPGATVPIGAPVYNTQAYVLDAALRPLPTGVAGDLYIAGDQLARGFLGRPGLTAERFVANPFEPGTRMYRTGDLVRWRPDGLIEHLGRVDDQVKIRGFRVEPGEIENTLHGHPAVHRAVVLPHGSGAARSLVAYVTPTQQWREEARSGVPLARPLKEHLAARLPDYMVPTAFVVLDELPVNRNGKVDRGALPAPSEADLAREEYVAPHTATQRELCRIVAEVLGVSRVGLNDTFFDLGGHSLVATRLSLRVKKEMGADLPLQVIFTASGMAEMAAAVDDLFTGRQSPAGAAGPVAVHDGDEAPLSLQQQDLWFLERPEHLAAAHDNVQLAFRLDGPLDRDAFARSVRALVERHAILRTGYHEHPDGTLAQRVNDAAEFAVTVAPAPQDAVGLATWLRAERARPFAPEGPYALRSHLLTLADDRHIAVLTRPWGVFDGWSVSIVLTEQLALYRAIARGGEPELTPLPMGYADFARWQRTAVPVAELDRQRGYWRRRLAGLPACLSLRSDYERCPVKTYQGSSVDLSVPLDVAAGLQRLGRERGATSYMVLLSAFAVLLGGYADDHDLVIGSPVANRPRSELEGVVGYFVNMLPMRLDAAPQRTFSELLAQAKDVAGEAHAHKDLPLADLVRTLVPRRDPGRSPLFQTTFNLLPTWDTALGDGPDDLTVTQVRVDAGTARYDLSLVVQETGEGLAGYLEYSTDLFTSATAERMARGYERLLAQIARDPGATLADLREKTLRTDDRTPQAGTGQKAVAKTQAKGGRRPARRRAGR